MWRVKGRVGLQGWGAGAGLLGSPPSTSLLLSHAVPPQLSQRECGLGQSQPCWSLSLHIAHVLTRYLGVWVLYGATDGQHSACGAELCQPEHFRGPLQAARAGSSWAAHAQAEAGAWSQCRAPMFPRATTHGGMEQPGQAFVLLWAPGVSLSLQPSPAPRASEVPSSI